MQRLHTHILTTSPHILYYICACFVGLFLPFFFHFFHSKSKQATELPSKVHDIALPYGYVSDIKKREEEELKIIQEQKEKEAKETEAKLKKTKSMKMKKSDIREMLTKKNKKVSDSNLSNKKNDKKKDKKKGRGGVDDEDEEEDLGLTFLEHMDMQRELRRPLAMCTNQDEYKNAMKV